MFKNGEFFETRPRGGGVRVRDYSLFSPDDLWAQARLAHFEGDLEKARALRQRAEKLQGGANDATTTPAVEHRGAKRKLELPDVAALLRRSRASIQEARDKLTAHRLPPARARR